MFKQRNTDHLELIKTTKTQANYQMLLLQMMGKLVSQTKESNRILRKVAGEQSYKTQKLPSLTPILYKKESSEVQTPKNVRRQSYQESESQSRDFSDKRLTVEQHRSSQPQQNCTRSVELATCFKVQIQFKIQPNQKKVHLFNNKFNKIQFFDHLSNIQQLSLNHGPIQNIESILHLAKLEELNFGKTLIIDLKPLANFKKITKLSVDGLNINIIGPIFQYFDSSQIHLMSRKHFKLIYSKPGEAESQDRQPVPEFYERYNAVLQHRISSSSGSGSSDSDSD